MSMYLLLFCNKLLTKFTAQASAVPGAAQSAELILVQVPQRQALGLDSHRESQGCSHAEPFLWPMAVSAALPLLLWPLPLSSLRTPLFPAHMHCP